MPAQVEACVTSLMRDWKSGKKKKPTRYKSGDKWKPVRDDKDLRSAAWGICQASVQGESDLPEYSEVPFDNPVMTAIGATNKPVIMGLQPISTYEVEEGKKMAKIPILVLGRWLYRDGVLNFTEQVVEKLRNSLLSGDAGHDVALDARHYSDRGAMAWVKDLVTDVLDSGKKQVSAIAELTKWGIEALENGLFKYASIEFHPNFKNRMLSGSEALSFEEGTEFVFLEDGEMPQHQEDEMPEETPVTEQGSAVSLEQFNEIQLKLQQMEERLQEEQSRSAALEQMAVRQFVDSIVVRAENYRDEQKRAHSKVALDWLRSVMLSQPIGEDGVISLSSDDPADIRAYYRKAINYLFEHMPGVVPMSEPETEQHEERMQLEHNDSEPTQLSEDELREIREDIWGKAPASDGGE